MLKIIQKTKNLTFGDLNSPNIILTVQKPIHEITSIVQKSKYSFIKELNNQETDFDFLIRNLLANPQITTIIFTGNSESVLTTLLIDFFKQNIEQDLKTQNWKIKSQYTSIIGKDIPYEDIQHLRNNINVIWLENITELNIMKLESPITTRQKKIYLPTDPKPEIPYPKPQQEIKQSTEIQQPKTEEPKIDYSNYIELIKNQEGSNNKIGWPVAVRDRITYPSRNENIVTSANTGLVFLWTIRDEIIPNINKENLSIATNFYTPAGLEGMIRNILANPFIRYIILLGNEYAAKDKKKNAELTSANAIRQFFRTGINKQRKLEGFEQAVNFDKNIPTELINKVAQEIKLIDLNQQMPGATLQEQIQETNRLLQNLEKKGPFLESPVTFAYEKIEESFPYEGGPMIAQGQTIPETWINIMHTINRYGIRNLMDANTDRWIKEINNLVAVIHNPDNIDLSINPFLVPLTIEKIQAYQKEILSPELPEGKAYTYGNKLRAYQINNANYIKGLITSSGFKDFEFGKGDHLEDNIKYSSEGCTIDQINELIEVLKRNLYSKSGIAITWHVEDELIRKHKSSPCLVFIQPIVQNNKLNLFTYFRSHDMVQGWPENAYGCAAIQKRIADGLNIEPGILTITSGSAQIYKHYFQQVEDMLAEHYKYEISYKDHKGHYTIQLKDNQIHVTHLHPENNRELEKFEGTTVAQLIKKISEKVRMLDPSHALDLGSELQKAELALKNNLEYIQDKPITINKQQDIKEQKPQEPQKSLPEIKPKQEPKIDLRKGELNFNKILNSLGYRKK